MATIYLPSYDVRGAACATRNTLSLTFQFYLYEVFLQVFHSVILRPNINTPPSPTVRPVTRAMGLSPTWHGAARLLGGPSLNMWAVCCEALITKKLGISASALGMHHRSHTHNCICLTDPCYALPRRFSCNNLHILDMCSYDLFIM